MPVSSQGERTTRDHRAARAMAAGALLPALLLLCGTATTAGARAVAVAVDEAGGGASIALVDVRPPWRARTGTVPIGRDSILRSRGRVVYALSRRDGTLHVVDPPTAAGPCTWSISAPRARPKTSRW